MCSSVIRSAAAIGCLSAGPVLACPGPAVVAPWDGLNGERSQDSGTVSAVAVRAADDFTLPTGFASQPWNIRQVTADVLADFVPAPATMGLEIFADASLPGVGPVPGARQYLLIGASTVTDQGVATGALRRYRVRFLVPAGAAVVPANQRRWVSVYAVGPVPASCYLGTAGNGVVTGLVGRANRNYPTGAWQSIDQCCIGASDFAVRVRAVQTPTADHNCSGISSVQDIFDFLASYFMGDLIADFNFNGTISSQDLFDFLGAYFSGA